jgi:hypothetical protein
MLKLLALHYRVPKHVFDVVFNYYQPPFSQIISFKRPQSGTPDKVSIKM